MVSWRRWALLTLARATFGCKSKSDAPTGATLAATERPLVVYLHGVVRPGTEKAEEAQRRELTRRAEARGFEVWAPSGEKGLCDWSDDVRGDVCWPSDERRLEDAKRIALGWKPRLRERRTHLLGFSNGAAFALLLTAHGLVPTACVAALHGAPAGALHVTSIPRSPILGYAGDAPWEKPQLEAALAPLRDAGANVRLVTASGPHALDAPSIDAALGFFGECAPRTPSSNVD